MVFVAVNFSIFNVTGPAYLNVYYSFYINLTVCTINLLRFIVYIHTFKVFKVLLRIIHVNLLMLHVSSPIVPSTLNKY